MKRTKAYATLMVMGVFAYLLMAITFWQSAWAEECDVDQVCFIHNLANSDDSNYEAMALFTVVTSVQSYEAGFIDALATIAARDETQVDTKSWLETYKVLGAEYETCEIFGWQNRDVLRSWLTFTMDKKGQKVTTATVLYMNTVCDEQTNTTTRPFIQPNSDPQTKAKEQS